MFMRPAFYFDKDSDGGGNAGGGDGDKPQTRAFTQKELDDMFAERARRAGEAAMAELLAKLGVKTLDEAQAVFKKAKEADDASKTALEKLQGEHDAMKKKAEQAEADKATAIAQSNERLMKAEIMAQAQTQGFRSEALPDVWLVVDRTKITEKDGQFTGVKEAVEAVAKSKPFWLGTEKPSGRGTPKPVDKTGGGGDKDKQVPETPAIRL